jgi:hypothetical protein
VRLIDRRLAPLLLVLGALSGCRERAAALMRFDAAMPAPPEIVSDDAHQVHYTFTAPDAVTFDWSGSDGALRFWAKDVPPRIVTAHPPTPLPASSSGPWREAVADGLIPGREYFYEIGHPVRPVTQTFRSPPARGGSGFVFAAVGEIGTATETATVAALHRGIRLVDPSFVLGLGGLSFAAEQGASAVDRHFEDVMVWSRRAAYMPLWGSAEWTGGDRDDLRNYKGRFALPHAAAASGAPAAGCCGEDWYWFDQGRVRIVGYPEPYTAETWRAWARTVEPIFAAAEADTAIRFIVTAGHRAAYSSTEGGGNPELRAILDGFGKRFSKYVLALAGEARAYERSKPQGHVVHVTAGIGGAPLARASTPCGWPDCKPPAWSAFRALHHGFVKVAVRASSLSIELICAGPTVDEGLRCGPGEILDQFELP